MIGKWHMGHGEGHDPEGFDHWDVLPGQGDYWNPTFISAEGRRTVEGYATDIITDLAIDWVESLEGDDPWCVLVWHKAPHRPWEPKPEHRALFDEHSAAPRDLLRRLLVTERLDPPHGDARRRPHELRGSEGENPPAGLDVR